MLSEYVKGLESCVKHQYLGKIAAIRIDPALVVVAKLDPECIPLIEAADLLSYLVLETSPQEFGGLQPDDFWLYNKHSKQNNQ